MAETGIPLKTTSFRQDHEGGIINNIDVHLYDDNNRRRWKKILMNFTLINLCALFAIIAVVFQIQIMMVKKELHLLHLSLVNSERQMARFNSSVMEELNQMKAVCAKGLETPSKCGTELNELFVSDLDPPRIRRSMALKAGARNRKMQRQKGVNWKRIKQFCLNQRFKSFTKRLISEQAKIPQVEVNAAHFVGGVPEIFLKDTGTIGPWFYDGKNASVTSIKLMKENKSVEIQDDGVYFLYAQVYYLSMNGSNSFSIVRSQISESHSEETLATCSITEGTIGEVSCFTATVSTLTKGDKLYIVQREQKRKVLFSEGKTYFGLVLLTQRPLTFGIGNSTSITLS